ncbi:MAG: DUF1456 family protein [Deltaproteobacteria bacterium]|nr:DUF1456 family protein [Deltaproteobacteria bacterium]
MTNNDILRRLRYALDLDDLSLVKFMESQGVKSNVDEVRAQMLRDDDPEAIPLDNASFEALLDGFIVARRGPPPEGATPPPKVQFNNNVILKKLRIALSMRNTDILDVVALGGRTLSKAELGGLMRPPDHRHYRPCGDQLLRAFLAGLTKRERG